MIEDERAGPAMIAAGAAQQGAAADGRLIGFWESDGRPPYLRRSPPPPRRRSYPACVGAPPPLAKLPTIESAASLR